jgi:hypothetical protein
MPFADEFLRLLGARGRCSGKRIVALTHSPGFRIRFTQGFIPAKNCGVDS